MRLDVWAPDAHRVAAVLADDATTEPGPGSTAPPEIPLHRSTRSGWWSVDDERLRHEGLYRVRLDDRAPLPDPRAACFPKGVDGPGMLYDHARFTWSDQRWQPTPFPDAVIDELHVGTYTPQGTLDAAAQRLDHLVDLGVTHVELLPLAGFGGVWGWGYDGVSPWSVHAAYGGPDAFKRFVDTCHSRGLAVLLDLVLNHLGPLGAYLPQFGPVLTDAHLTPWGSAINLDAEGARYVRDLLTDCVTGVIEHYHLDGLRLDATHELRDSGSAPFLAELADATAVLSRRVGREIVLIAEDDRNQPKLTEARSRGGWGVRAQWDDDVHHSLHVLLTGEAVGYYADFAQDPYAAVRTTLTGGFFHAGTYSSFRDRVHGAPVDRTAFSGDRLVVALQTHDQVGNRATGERLSALAPPGLLACGAALLLTCPFVPMLFMGEEWAASTPWQFFTSFPDPSLGNQVTDGRRREFAAYGWNLTDVPDPQDPETFRRSRLAWEETTSPGHARMLTWYRNLIRLRAAVRDLRDHRLDRVRVDTDAAAGIVVVHRGDHRVVVNVKSQAVDLPWRRVAVGDADVAVRPFASSAREETAGAPEKAEILLAWDLAQDLGDVLRVPGRSAAVVRLF